jgi:hypothetical protein
MCSKLRSRTEGERINARAGHRDRLDLVAAPPHHLGMDRRRFLLTSVAGALAVPRIAEAQTAKTYRVAVLGPFSTPEGLPYREAFFDGMRDLGYVEGRNVIFDVRTSDRDRVQVPALVDELIALKPDVLVSDGNAVRVIRDRTTSIPIVLTTSIDPIGQGVAQSLRRPGMNVTGVSLFLDQLSAKHIEIMREIPLASRASGCSLTRPAMAATSWRTAHATLREASVQCLCCTVLRTGTRSSGRSRKCQRNVQTSFCRARQPCCSTTVIYFTRVLCGCAFHSPALSPRISL